MATRRPRVPHQIGNLEETADFFGVDQRTVRNWFNKGCPRELEDVFLIVTWWAENIKVQQALKASGKLQEFSDMAELKMQKLRQEIRDKELAFAVKAEVLVPSEDLQVGLDRISSKLRAAGEILQRRHGDDAQLIILEALEDCEAELGEMFGEGRLSTPARVESTSEQEPCLFCGREDCGCETSVS